MKLTSPAFDNESFIPEVYTCVGSDINPRLDITDIPEKSASLALIMDDPDAPGGTFVHWVVYDMPVMPSIEEDSVPGIQGANDFQRVDYGGPCPPGGTHRYYFKLYALDRKLELQPGVKKAELEQHMQGHILGRAELMGRFTKEGR